MGTSEEKPTPGPSRPGQCLWSQGPCMAHGPGGVGLALPAPSLGCLLQTARPGLSGHSPIPPPGSFSHPQGI